MFGASALDVWRKRPGGLEVGNGEMKMWKCESVEAANSQCGNGGTAKQGTGNRERGMGNGERGDYNVETANANVANNHCRHSNWVLGFGIGNIFTLATFLSSSRLPKITTGFGFFYVRRCRDSK